MSNVKFTFSGKNVEAQRAAAAMAAKTVAGITKETQKAIRSVIVRSIREGIPPREAASMIVGHLADDGMLRGGLAGLNSAQAQAAMDYRDRLSEVGLSAEKAEARFERYVEDKLGDRAETIARTETMDALNEGILEGARQAQADGLLSEPVKEWIATGDEITCVTCSALDGVQVALNELFQTDEGEEIESPPAHPRCRCSVAITEGETIPVESEQEQ